MARLTDLKLTFGELTIKEAYDLIRERRAARRDFVAKPRRSPTRKAGTRAASSSPKKKKLTTVEKIDKMSEKEQLRMLAILEEKMKEGS